MKEIFNGRYLLGEDGKVISNVCRKTNRKGQHEVCWFLDKDGYKRIALFVEQGKRKKIHVHRLVATYYVENPNNKPIVNHMDGDITNNHYTNLEWVTASENTIHAIKIGLIDIEKRRCKKTGRFLSESERSTTMRKQYTQASGNGEHLEKDVDIV